jgi:hypothetical protein
MSTKRQQPSDSVVSREVLSLLLDKHVVQKTLERIARAPALSTAELECILRALSTLGFLVAAYRA